MTNSLAGQLDALGRWHAALLARLDGRAGTRLRGAVGPMQRSMRAWPLNRHTRQAFTELCARLHGLRVLAQSRGAGNHAMLGASHARLNAAFGLGLAPDAAPGLRRFARVPGSIERARAHCLRLKHALRHSQARVQSAGGEPEQCIAVLAAVQREQAHA